MALPPAAFASAQKLPASRAAWELGAFASPARIADTPEPWVLLCAHSDGLVRHVDMLPGPPTAMDWERFLLKACSHPASQVAAARPLRLQVASAEVAGALARAARLLGNKVEVTERLPALFEAHSSLTDALGPVRVSSLGKDLQLRLWQAIARWAELAPWQTLADDVPVHFMLPIAGWERPVATILGNARQICGFVLFRSNAQWEAFDLAAQDPVDGHTALEHSDAVVVWLEPADSLSATARAQAERAQLPIGRGLYPTVVRLLPERPPAMAENETDVRALSAALEAFSQLWQEQLDSLKTQPTAIAANSYPTPDGPVHVAWDDASSLDLLTALVESLPPIVPTARSHWSIEPVQWLQQVLTQLQMPAAWKRRPPPAVPVLVLKLPEAELAAAEARLEQVTSLTFYPKFQAHTLQGWCLLAQEPGHDSMSHLSDCTGRAAALAMGAQWAEAVRSCRYQALVAIAPRPAAEGPEEVVWQEVRWARWIGVQRIGRR